MMSINQSNYRAPEKSHATEATCYTVGLNTENPRTVWVSVKLPRVVLLHAVIFYFAVVVYTL